jgi:uncharacterized protein (UPF0332 family)
MTDEQRDLLVQAHRSLEAAQLMAENEYFDFAISRAYYTMFYVASALLLQKGLRFSKHSAVISAFGKEFAASGQVSSDMHKHFIKAQEARTESDYTPLSSYTAEDAARYIGYARGFIELGERMLAEEPSQAAEVDGHEE